MLASTFRCIYIGSASYTYHVVAMKLSYYSIMTAYNLFLYWLWTPRTWLSCGVGHSTNELFSLMKLQWLQLSTGSHFKSVMYWYHMQEVYRMHAIIMYKCFILPSNISLVPSNHGAFLINMYGIHYWIPLFYCETRS